MHKSTLKPQSFQYGAVILVVSVILVKIIGALFKIPLARFCLGDLGFGYFSSAYDLFTPIYSLAMAGLPVAVSRMVAEKAAKNHFKDVRALLKVSTQLYLITGLLGFFLMLVLIYPFVRLTDTTGNTFYSLVAITPAVFFCCLMSSFRGYYEGLRNMYPTAVSEVIEALGKLILGLGFSYFTVKITGNVAFGAAAAMSGITLGTIFSTLYLYIYNKFKGDGISRKMLESSPPSDDYRILMKTLLIIAIPVVLASLSNNIASLVDAITVKWQLSHIVKENSEVLRSMYSFSISDYNSNAIAKLSDNELPTLLYGVRGKAYTLYNLIPTLTSVIGVTAIPVISSYWSSGDAKLTKTNINSVIRLTAMISFPAGAGFIAAGPQIMKLVYVSSASVEMGGSMLRIFGLTALFSGLAISCTCILQALGKQGAALRNIAIGTLLKIIVNLVFVRIPKININGAPLGTLVCYLVILFADLLTIKKCVGFIPNVKSVFVKPFFAALASGISAAFVLMIGNSKAIIIFSVLTAVAVYFIVLIGENAFEKNDILSFPNGNKLLNFLEKLKIIR